MSAIIMPHVLSQLSLKKTKNENKKLTNRLDDVSPVWLAPGGGGDKKEEEGKKKPSTIIYALAIWGHEL